MKFIKTKKGILVSKSEYFGTPIFINAQNAAEINNDNVYIKFQCIYGDKAVNALEQKFEKSGQLIEENTDIKTIFEKICTSLDERTDFDQEMANIEWEISMAVHRG